MLKKKKRNDTNETFTKQEETHRLKEKELLFTREGTVIQLDTYNAILKTGNQQRPT